ncbi:hypothetical protein C8F04DRAFT_624058 [Mycena alexandri]|uniref:Uncharacterized protein n=1 Tax=Mycena alexandri TaxID=1745969 RepID=A0AAD6SST2_9AGAR|nr:hypothetical protein C8F04DRAFT_624058 [Mycena alexandri]
MSTPTPTPRPLPPSQFVSIFRSPLLALCALSGPTPTPTRRPTLISNPPTTRRSSSFLSTVLSTPLLPLRISKLPSTSPLSLSASFESDSVAAQFHAELRHILPEQVQKDLFLIDEESLREMDDELFAAPMDAFIDLCLAKLRPPTPIPTEALEESDDASASCPTYYLASYLDPQRHDDAVLPPTIRSLFRKHTLSTSPQASPAAARQITPFL